MTTLETSGGLTACLALTMSILGFWLDHRVRTDANYRSSWVAGAGGSLFGRDYALAFSRAFVWMNIAGALMGLFGLCFFLYGLTGAKLFLALGIIFVMAFLGAFTLNRLIIYTNHPKWAVGSAFRDEAGLLEIRRGKGLKDKARGDGRPSRGAR